MQIFATTHCCKAAAAATTICRLCGLRPNPQPTDAIINSHTGHSSRKQNATAAHRDRADSCHGFPLDTVRSSAARGGFSIAQVRRAHARADAASQCAGPALTFLWFGASRACNLSGGRSATTSCRPLRRRVHPSRPIAIRRQRSNVSPSQRSVRPLS